MRMTSMDKSIKDFDGITARGVMLTLRCELEL